MFQKVVHLAEGIENENTVRTALLLYKAKTVHGVGFWSDPWSLYEVTVVTIALSDAG